MKRVFFVLVFLWTTFNLYAMQTFSYNTERGLVYADLGSQKLKMTMYLPEDDAKCLRPGMVLIHGGAWILGTRYQQAWYCREFAKHGYVVMTIDYRLMPKCAFPDCLHDCKAAVRWLRLNAAKYRVDPERIVTFGASAGGHLAALLATTSQVDNLEGDVNPGASSEVKAAISLYGAVDLAMYREHPFVHKSLNGRTSHFFNDFTTRNMGEMNGAALEAASPMHYAGPDSKPIFFAHGKSDRLVHFEQSEHLYQRLQENGVATQLVALENRGHGFDYIFWGQRREIFMQMLEFLRAQGCGPADQAAKV